MTAALLAGGAVAFAVLGYLYGYFRAAVGVGMGLFILIAGIRFVRQMVVAPPEPEITDVSDYGLKYVCENCGLELKVEKAAHDRPPRHCSEAMHLVSEGGKPPLRPV